ncbi:hypothetical protein [Chryseobacterium taihuense]|uniref:YD repeat-containing protein n=1 Tax=Chryseobacterium taihuense TaxID=1141221 RepID=A0ABY0QWI4_9FLAO|nr:hypothetical protein [Chryseobacterium taihuense]SDM02508.1 hypothetical protein SAMN05216273_1112 [Chryseobacterium taihuense]
MRKIIFLFILLPYLFKSQSNIDKSLPDIKPPSVETYKFSVYGVDFKNSNSGEFNYSFPIYSIGNTINIPVSLAYNSGVKVDDMGGNVGMSWQLVAGGAISRVIRDEQDETSPSAWFPQNIDITTHANQIKGAAQLDNSIDTEYDWFSFSLSNGLSGQFYIDKDLNVHYSAEDGSKLMLTDKTTMLTQYGKNLEFVLTDNQGNKYFFGGADKFMERSKINYKGADKFYTSGWYLAKVITNKNEVINFDYSIETLTYYSSMSAAFTVSESCCFPNTYENSGLTKSKTTMLSLKPKLVTIEDDKVKIGLSYGKNRADLLNGNGTLLTSIKVLPKLSTLQIKNYVLQYDDVNSGSATTYYGLPLTEQSTVNRHYLKQIQNTVSNEIFKFEYYSKESIPARFSLATDFYGYANGKSNHTPFPNVQGQLPNIIFNKTSGYASADKTIDPARTYIGNLKRIYYPTGGYSEITYESNSSMVTLPVQKNSTSALEVTRNCNNARIMKKKFTFVSNGSDITYMAHASTDYSNCGEPDFHEVHGVSIRNLTTGQFVKGHNEDYNVDLVAHTNSCLTGLPSEKTCPVKTIAGHTYEVEYFVSSYLGRIDGYIAVTYNSRIEMESVLKHYGGSRVKKIEEKNTENGTYSRWFYYNKLANIGSQETSIANANVSKSFDYLISTRNCDLECAINPPTVNYFSKYPIPVYRFYKDNILSDFNDRSNKIFYKSITEVIENKNAYEHNYRYVGDVESYLYDPPILDAPHSNFGQVQRGLLEQENQYLFENNLYKKFKQIDYAYAIAQNYITSFIFKQNSSIPQNYIPDVHDGPIPNISYTFYNNYYGYSKLIGKKTKEFINGQVLETNHNTFFGNNAHLQPTHEQVTHPDSKITETTYQYAHEKNNVKLINANMIGIPLETSVIKKQSFTDAGKSIAKTEIKYDNPAHLFPTSVLSFDFQSNASTEVTYDQYDNKGNILQYTTKDGIPTSIIWGYNGTQPVAKIEGAVYDNIKNNPHITAIINASNSDAANPATENNLIAALDALRNDINFKDFQMATYTYDPLIGVTSITPPSGIREIYKYDTANRLEKIVDINGKVLKEFKYNYKP